MKVKKKPVEVEAIKYTGDNKREVIKFTEGLAMTNTCYSHLTISTLEGMMDANVGDYIIKGVNGEFYPCKPDIFAKTYDIIPEGDASE